MIIKRQKETIFRANKFYTNDLLLMVIRWSFIQKFHTKHSFTLLDCACVFFNLTDLLFYFFLGPNQKMSERNSVKLNFSAKWSDSFKAPSDKQTWHFENQ